ncbi:MAG: hypothetical protein OSB25_00210 [Salibacteraceae bacterium]|nr:hypothetical protein [Salibacteraceae bacterium]
MKLIRIISFLITILSTQLAFGQTERTTDASEVAMTISNIGLYGNAFKGSYPDNPSCKYPSSSGVEHLFEAGLWIGAIVRGSANVSSTAYDNSKGFSPGTGGYEFTSNENAVIKERSTLFNSRVYNPSAVSHQDFIMDFSEKDIKIPGTEQIIVNHIPLGLDVHLETYNWNYAFSNFFVILNYSVTNVGDDILDSIYVGMFSNAVVRNVNVAPAGSGGSAFFNKGGNGFNDSLHLGYCYDNTGDAGFTESYFSHKFLGAESKDAYYHPSINPTFNAHYNVWRWGDASLPLLFSPQDDAAKYRKMTSGLNWRNEWSAANDSTNQHTGTYIHETINDPGNRSDLVSVGPFARLNPGESIDIAFAIVCAKKNEDGNPNGDNTAFQQQNLISNAQWAQTAYLGEDINGNGILDPTEDRNQNGNLDRYILPSPPDAPITKIEAKDGELNIYWTANSENSIDPISLKKDFAGYRVYLSRLGFDVAEKIEAAESLTEVGVYDILGDSLFFETGFDEIKLAEPITFEGDENLYLYKYTVKNLQNGWQYICAVSAFDTGDETNKLESLESAPLSNSNRVFMGTPPNKNPKENLPFAYPNPYYLEAAWEGFSTRQTTKKLIFANLPEKCVISIFNMAGDIVAQFDHDGNYSGNDIDWFTEFSDDESTVFSGGEHAWDLISSEGQALARGLYIFSVKDLNSNKIYKGKFTLIK